MKGKLLVLCALIVLLAAVAVPTELSAATKGGLIQVGDAYLTPAAASKGTIRLEAGTVAVKGLQLGDKSGFANGVITINAADLQKTLLTDKRLGRIDVNIAKPGDNTRIVKVVDVIEPRVKTGTRVGQFFYPGAMAHGSEQMAGNGSINILKGAAVVVTNAGAPAAATNASVAEGNIIQMTGAGSEVSDFSKTFNIIITVYPGDGVSANDYSVATGLASARAADYVGQLAQAVKPDSVKVFELGPVDQRCKGMENLPRVAYIQMFNWGNSPAIRGFGTGLGESIFYGDDAAELPPTIIHPNEVFDGALLSPRASAEPNFFFVDNPNVEELYANHGKTLCFVGMMITQSRYTAVNDFFAEGMAARSMLTLLHPDGVIINKYGGGAPQYHGAEIASLLEKAGVKIAYTPGRFCSVIFTQPEVINSLVNTGGGSSTLVLPKVDKAIGFHALSKMNTDVLTSAIGSQYGATNQLGGGSYKCETSPTDPDLDQKTVKADKTGSQRLVQMVLDKLAGKPVKSEIVVLQYPALKTAPALKDPSKAVIALVGTGGLGRVDDTVAFQSSQADRFAAYSIKGMDSFPLPNKEWRIIHGGYDAQYSTEDPNRVYPLDAARQMVKEGKIGTLDETMYTTSGLANFWAGMKKIGQGLIPRLKADGAQGVILTAT